MFSSPCYLLFNLLCSVNFALSSSLYLNLKKSDFFIFSLVVTLLSYGHCCASSSPCCRLLTVRFSVSVLIVLTVLYSSLLLSVLSSAGCALCALSCSLLSLSFTVLTLAHCTLLYSMRSLLLSVLFYAHCGFLCSLYYPYVTVFTMLHAARWILLCSLSSLLLTVLSSAHCAYRLWLFE